MRVKGAIESERADWRLRDGDRRRETEGGSSKKEHWEGGAREGRDKEEGCTKGRK